MAAAKEADPKMEPEPYKPPPDPQPALHALDVYRANIGGSEPRSPEQVEACDEAHDTLDEYFAAKDAQPMPETGVPHVQASAAGFRDPAASPMKTKGEADAKAKAEAKV